MSIKCPYCESTGYIEHPTTAALVMAARIAAGITYTDLVREYSWLSQKIMTIESNRADSVTVFDLQEIAAVLKCSPKDLIC